jgi:hypothetical protein
MPWVLIFAMVLGSSGRAFGENTAQSKDAEPRILAILDPIDLHGLKIDHEWGEFLRKTFADNPKWKIISHDSVVAKFTDFRLDPRQPCHEFQCAFDAGNILSAEFVLFGSITGTDELYAFTLNLVHVPTSQTVWSRVGEVRKRQTGVPFTALETALKQIAAELGPDAIRTGRREKHGLLTVLDLSASGSAPSRIMAERVATHLYASRNYDIMGRKEMEELLTALEINKSEFVPTDSGIFTLGGKMDITHLVYSRLLATREGGLQLQLALYDIAAKKKIREWPSQSTLDFRKLLEFEDKFFTGLFKVPEYPGAPAVAKTGGHWTWAGAGLTLAMGAVCGYMAYTATQDADRQYGRFQAARSREAAVKLQGKVQQKEDYALWMGIAGGVSLVGAGGFLIYSF